MTRPVILLGAGGHAKVLLDVLRLQRVEVLGVVAPRKPSDAVFDVVPWLGDDDDAVRGHAPADVLLVNAVGSIGDTTARRALFERWRGAGYEFLSLRHPAAVVSALQCVLGHGVQIMAGAVVNPGARVGDDVIVNTRAVVEHDCEVGAHCHIASGALLCGGVRLGAGVHVGAGATIIQGITVGAGSLIASGAVVTKNVDPLTLVAGVPARPKRQLRHE
jgi:UDP-perosamine 4-acetyltransferase